MTPHRQGIRAAKRCQSNAMRVGFSPSSAREFVLRYLRYHDKAPGERIVLAAKKAGHVPHDDRAFGPVFGSLKKRGRILDVGHCFRARGHGASGGRIWAVVR